MLVDPEDLASRAGPKPFIVDVRDPAEYMAGHIPGSVNIPVAELAERRLELPTDRPIVTYCNLRHPGNARCEQAAEFLSAHRHEALVLGGGFTGWKAAGRPVAQGPDAGGAAGTKAAGPPDEE